MNDEKIVSDLLTKLGFDSRVISLYITLLKNGPLTILEASRKSHIERTKLYRIIDRLREGGIIQTIPEYKRLTIKAVDPESIELMVKERSLESRILEETLQAFRQAACSLSKALPGNNVVYYRGPEGIKQMVWRILRCDGLMRAFSYSYWDEIFGSSFSMRLNAGLRERHIRVHDLYSDEYIRYKENWLKSGRKKPAGDWSFWDSRYIPETILKINQNVDIYNDVVQYYYWHEGEIFGVQIQNQRLADLQKQIHDFLWKTAVKRPEIRWTKKGLR